MDPQRESVLRLIRRRGHNATCFQILEQGFRYWFDGEDACVAFVDTGSAWVAAVILWHARGARAPAQRPR